MSAGSSLPEADAAEVMQHLPTYQEEEGEEEEEEGGVTRSYKEKANSNRPIGPYKAVRYLT